MTWAISTSVGRPPGTTCSDACAWATAREQRRQAYLGRRVTSTRSWAGITSSRSDTFSPILAISPHPQGQSVVSGSIIRSIRGRCFGRCPRLRFGEPFSARPGYGQARFLRCRQSRDGPRNRTSPAQGIEQSGRSLAPAHPSTRENHGALQVPGSGATVPLSARSDRQLVPPETPSPLRPIIPPCED